MVLLACFLIIVVLLVKILVVIVNAPIGAMSAISRGFAQ